MFLKLVNFCIALNTVIIIIGLFGVFFNKRNVLLILIFIEVIFIGLNLNFSIISIYLDDILGHILIIFILTIAAGESALILSLIILLYRLKKTINVSYIKKKLKSSKCHSLII